MITFFTIVLDGEPWIEHHYPVFTQLARDWRWIIVEGVASNVACTRWCNSLEPRLSGDGTREYLDLLAAADSRVTVMRDTIWPGKVAMCNSALSAIREPCLLWQIDSDELWTAAQISAVAELFDYAPDRNCAWFWCRYFVGPSIVLTTRDPWSNNPAYEWRRVWRFTPGQRFLSHEPPVMADFTPSPFTHAETAAVNAIFNHQAYSTLAQVRFKERYYSGSNNPVGAKYCGLAGRWLELQANRQWPVQLNRYFPFAPDSAMAAPVTQA